MIEYEIVKLSNLYKKVNVSNMNTKMLLTPIMNKIKLRNGYLFKKSTYLQKKNRQKECTLY